MVRTKLHQCQRQALLVIQIALAGQGHVALAEHTCRQFLGARLTDATGNADHFEMRAGPMQTLKCTDNLKGRRAIVDQVGDGLARHILFRQARVTVPTGRAYSQLPQHRLHELPAPPFFHNQRLSALG